MAGGDAHTRRDKALDNARAYEYARDSGHSEFIEKANKCRDFFASYPNKQWDEATYAKLMAQGRPALTINKIFPTLSVIMGEQLQNSVDVSFRPTAAGNPETATALDLTWVHVQNTNMLPWVRSQVADSGFITGRGFFDIRMDFSDNLRGDIKISQPNAKNVVIDPDAEDYDPDGWSEVFTSKWLTPDDIAMHYSTAAAKELMSRPRSMIPWGSDHIAWPITRISQDLGKGDVLERDKHLRRFVRVVERQHRELRRVEHFVDTVSGEVRPIPSTWDRERISRVLGTVPDLGTVYLQARQIRWTVSADDILLFDEVSPYKHFTVVPFFPFFFDGLTVGLVEHLISPQENLNKTRSQELHVINTSANSGWVVVGERLRNMTVEELEERGAETGLVLDVDDVAAIDKIQPNQIPTGLDRASFKADGDIDEISLVGRSLRGMDREDVAAKAIQAKSVRGAVNMAKPMSNLNRTDHLLASRALSLLQTFYDEERIIRVVDPRDPEQTPHTIHLNDPHSAADRIVNDLTLGEYEVITSAVTQREQVQDTEFEQAVAMRELGVAIPDSVLIRTSRLTGKDQILASLEPDEEEERTKQLENAKIEAEIEKLKTDNMVRRAEAVKLIADVKNAQSDPELEIKREANQIKHDANEIKRQELRQERSLAILELEDKRNERAERAKQQGKESGTRSA